MIKKGIILAGGLGTRMSRLTKAVNKQLLPIYDRPLIYYPLSILMLSGIRDILIVVNKGQLKQFKKILPNGNNLGIKITYKEDLKVLELLFTKTYEEIVGLGFDVHKFSKKPSKIIRLGGIDIKFSKKLEGHSDADVVLHAIVDSILGILNKGDIGQIFSNTDPKWKNANSKIFIQYVTSKLIKLKYLIRHLDITIICEEPKISKHSQKMIIRISELLNIPKNLIAIKATTSEGLGITGKKEGIAVKCLTTIAKPIKNEY